MTKYESIAGVLKQRIQDNIYKTGTLLPNQTDLATEFGVSRMTINKAINILTMEGFVSSQRGFGTKILNHPLWNKDVSPVNEYRGLSFQMGQQQRKITSQVISFTVAFPDSDMQKRLILTAQQPVYQIARLRIVDDEPFILERTIMPVDLIPNLTDSILKKSIYRYIQVDLGLQIAGAYRNIQASRADDFDIKYLDCQPTDPVLEVEQVAYLKNGRPFEYSRSRNRYDKRGYTELDMRN
ncbi:GntR family transcriptional regulator [Lapidilactobacillus bayanensis]|uniref:GntR family transcriptional regulator n=1 Tax=Lapidilactobacillus bayanensis TaxID=2485998 RepID=UPI00177E60EE|nr:GntR family transcriptional regulator [Lapidilactobacillus bayanensis]